MCIGLRTGWWGWREEYVGRTRTIANVARMKRGGMYINKD